MQYSRAALSAQQQSLSAHRHTVNDLPYLPILVLHKKYYYILLQFCRSALCSLQILLDPSRAFPKMDVYIQIFPPVKIRYNGASAVRRTYTSLAPHNTLSVHRNTANYLLFLPTILTQKNWPAVRIVLTTNKCWIHPAATQELLQNSG